MSGSLIVVTDLDATLLDEDTYSPAAAAPALAALGAAAIPLVLCSSKTRAEMRTLAAALDARAPFIVENGAAIVAPRALPLSWPTGAEPDGDEMMLVLGARRETLAPALAAIASEAGVVVESMTSMTIERVAVVTNLSREAARLAAAREFSEPFLATPSDDAAHSRLREAAAGHGCRVTRGGRFWHLIGASDKGDAVRRLRALLRGSGSDGAAIAALGDAPNDLEMLAAADWPIIVPHREGPDPVLRTALPDAQVAPAPGPAGWNLAVLGLLQAGAGRPSPES